MIYYLNMHHAGCGSRQPYEAPYFALQLVEVNFKGMLSHIINGKDYSL